MAFNTDIKGVCRQTVYSLLTRSRYSLVFGVLGQLLLCSPGQHRLLCFISGVTMVMMHNTGHPGCNVGHRRHCPAWAAETQRIAIPMTDSSISLSSLGIFVAMTNFELAFYLCELLYPCCFELPGRVNHPDKLEFMGIAVSHITAHDRFNCRLKFHYGRLEILIVS